MADLFRSEYELGSERRGVEDGERLWQLLAEDGTITIVDDPTDSEIEAAQKKLSKIDHDDPEAMEDPKTKALQRTVSFTPPPDAQTPPEALAPEKNVTGAQPGEVEAGKALGEGKVEKAGDKK